MASKSRQAIAKLNVLSSYETDPEKREQYKECINALLKDLEVLDILKKRIYIISQTKDLVRGIVVAETIEFWLNSVDKDYTKIKEWLENDK